MAILAQAIAGLVFGLGLLLSGMADPAKVTNFLDVFGQFDPSLLLVMGGAVVVAFIGYRIAWRRSRPVFAPTFEQPARTAIDRRLIGGAALFGIGWGLSGFCPGPAIVALPLMTPGALTFGAAMIGGLMLAAALPRR
jgi:uncharacterized protein